MFDIALYGHLTIDTIVEKHRNYQMLGGIANVWHSLTKLNSNIKIGIFPLSIGKALIYVDREKCERYSKAVLNSEEVVQSTQKSKIQHFMYINDLPNINLMSTSTGIITADICVGKELNLNILKYVDLLFISDEDDDNLEEIIKNTKGGVIRHYPLGSDYFYKGKIYKYSLPKKLMLNNINVLGAGDIFAASVLNYLSTYGLESLPNFIQKSHIDTYDLLKDQI